MCSPLAHSVLAGKLNGEWPSGAPGWGNFFYLFDLIVALERCLHRTETGPLESGAWDSGLTHLTEERVTPDDGLLLFEPALSLEHEAIVRERPQARCECSVDVGGFSLPSLDAGHACNLVSPSGTSRIPWHLETTTKSYFCPCRAQPVIPLV